MPDPIAPAAAPRLPPFQKEIRTVVARETLTIIKALRTVLISDPGAGRPLQRAAEQLNDCSEHGNHALGYRFARKVRDTAIALRNSGTTGATPRTLSEIEQSASCICLETERGLGSYGNIDSINQIRKRYTEAFIEEKQADTAQKAKTAILQAGNDIAALHDLDYQRRARGCPTTRRWPSLPAVFSPSRESAIPRASNQLNDLAKRLAKIQNAGLERDSAHVALHSEKLLSLVVDLKRSHPQEDHELLDSISGNLSTLAGAAHRNDSAIAAARAHDILPDARKALKAKHLHNLNSAVVSASDKIIGIVKTYAGKDQDSEQAGWGRKMESELAALQDCAQTTGEADTQITHMDALIQELPPAAGSSRGASNSYPGMEIAREIGVIRYAFARYRKESAAL